MHEDSVCVRNWRWVLNWCTEDRRVLDVNWNRSNKATKTHHSKVGLWAKFSVASAKIIILYTESHKTSILNASELNNTTKSTDGNLATRCVCENEEREREKKWVEYDVHNYCELSSTQLDMHACFVKGLSFPRVKCADRSAASIASSLFPFCSLLLNCLSPSTLSSMWQNFHCSRIPLGASLASCCVRKNVFALYLMRSTTWLGITINTKFILLIFSIVDWYAWLCWLSDCIWARTRHAKLIWIPMNAVRKARTKRVFVPFAAHYADLTDNNNKMNIYDSGSNVVSLLRTMPWLPIPLHRSHIHHPYSRWCCVE